MACVVERFIPKRGGMLFPRRIDAFNFGDILAMRPPMEGRPPAIALVQTTSGAGGTFAKHREKILATPGFREWKAAGGYVFLQGWVLRKRKDQRPRWELREEEL